MGGEGIEEGGGQCSMKELELNNGKREVEKQFCKETKKAHITMKETKGVFDLQ